MARGPIQALLGAAISIASKEKSSLADAANPDAFRGGFAEVNARRATAGDGERHGFVIFALVNSEARAGTKIEIHEKFQEVRIFFVHAEDFVSVAYFGFRKAHGAVFAAKSLHAAEERNTVRAAGITAKSLQE